MKVCTVFLAALSVTAAGVIPHGKFIGTITTQHHSQDELGQYSYGYAGGPSAKEEIKTADGVTRGGYSYVDGHGIVQSATYVSDPVNGFRVAATNLPVGPAVPEEKVVAEVPVAVPVAPAVVPAPVAPVVTHHLETAAVVPASSPALVAAPVAPAIVAPAPSVVEAHIEAQAAVKEAVEAEIKASAQAEADTAQAIADRAQAEADNVQAQADAVQDAADSIQSADELVKIVPVAPAVEPVVKIAHPIVVADAGVATAAAAEAANAEAVQRVQDQIALEDAKVAVTGSSSYGVISFPNQVKTVAVESVAPTVVVSTPRPSFEEVRIVSTISPPVVERVSADIPAPVYQTSVVAPAGHVASSALVSSVVPAASQIVSTGVIAKEVVPVGPSTVAVVKTPVVAQPTVALEHPGQITSQYHSQDELGQYSYGYAGGPSAKEEIKTADGVTKGGYAYIDAHGIVQQARYVSDPVHGFRVAATNLPRQRLPEYIPDSPEVEYAKQKLFHLQAQHIAQL